MFIHGRALRSMVAILCPLPLPSPVERRGGATRQLGRRYLLDRPAGQA